MILMKMTILMKMMNLMKMRNSSESSFRGRRSDCCVLLGGAAYGYDPCGRDRRERMLQQRSGRNAAISAVGHER